MTNRTGDLAITPERWAESEAKRRAEIARNPQLAAMSKANQYTLTEQSDLADAEAAVLATEAAHNAAGLALAQARTAGFLGREPADLDLLEQDLAEARLIHQNAIRRRGLLRRRFDAARAARRRAAKVQHAPKAAAGTSRAEWWGSTDRIRRGKGRKDAA